MNLEGHRRAAKSVLDDHDSNDLFNEFKTAIENAVDEEFLKRVRQSPIYGIPIDLKDNFGNLVITYMDTETYERRLDLLELGLVPSHGADDLFKWVVAVFKRKSLDVEKIWIFSADGASVNGTKKADDLNCAVHQGSNVARLLQDHVENIIVVTHCAAHKFFLACNESWRSVPYFPSMDKRITSLHNHIHHVP